jgi:hypothetical protein
MLEIKTQRLLNQPHRPEKIITFIKIGSCVVCRIPMFKASQKFRKKNSCLNMLVEHRPPFSTVRSFINSPSQRAFSSLGDLSSQDNPFSELSAISNLLQRTLL